MAKPPESALGLFIQAHAEGRPLAAIGHAIGVKDLSGKIAAVSGDRKALLNSRLLHRIADELDPEGRRLLVRVMAQDAQLPGHGPGEETERQTAHDRLDLLSEPAFQVVADLLVLLCDRA